MDIIRKKTKIGDIHIPNARTARDVILIFVRVVFVLGLVAAIITTGYFTWNQYRAWQTSQNASHKNAEDARDYTNIGGAPQAEQSTVSGKLCLPAGAMKNVVVAKNTKTGDVYQQEISGTPGSYAFSLTPATYYVRLQSYLDPAHPDSFVSSYFTACAATAQPSAASCAAESHALIPVTLSRDAGAGNVDLCDSYYGSKEPLF